VIQLLEELSALVDNQGRGGTEQPLISEYCEDVTTLGNSMHSGNCSPAFNYTYESLFYETRISFDEGRQIKVAEDHREELKESFQEKMRASKCFATDSSNMENKSFV
jgi:hypothetical protein